MNSEAEVERTLRNITVLSEIKQNDKLTTIADTFSIYPPTAMRGIWRKWQGESRDMNIQRIQETFSSASAYITSTRDTITRHPDDISRLHMHRRCSRIMEAMDHSKRGLLNLCHTYTDDATSRVKLHLIIQQIDDFLAVHASVRSSYRCASEQDGALSSPSVSESAHMTPLVTRILPCDPPTLVAPLPPSSSPISRAYDSDASCGAP